MATGFAFDDTMSERLERLYRSRDVVRRRRLVHDALVAVPGERILDVGCGPGFYVAELADKVGRCGAVVGVDTSAPMLAIAARKSAGRDNVGLHEADATALPVFDSSVDAALSVQVMEYVPDVDRALAELHRAVRPGGRLVIWDVDWSSVSWYTEDTERMRRVLATWDAHLAHPSLPTTLGRRLRRAGLCEVVFAGHVFATDALVPDAYGGALLDVVSDFVSPRLGHEVTEAWAAEQRQLHERGEFFFSCVQFCFTARRPN